MRLRFTSVEILVCTYLARYGRDSFDELRIQNVLGRKAKSALQKSRNIAWMLKEKGYGHHKSISPLSGVPKGAPPRWTDWDSVSMYIVFSKDEHLRHCKAILEC
ncbi:hypothetical protein [Vibrio parahaemolyticus]|uniref:hypothetical protein n=1 Tax=Vibrio parahaemolyticus TaxID=670 RepID=UPI001E518F16|nr:hypothetical protein [Vibrio parahaemolyticus]